MGLKSKVRRVQDFRYVSSKDEREPPDSSPKAGLSISGQPRRSIYRGKPWSEAKVDQRTEEVDEMREK